MKNNQPTPQSCSNCHFYQRKKTAPGNGFCRFDPPIRLGEGVSSYPTVFDAAWCGKWSEARSRDYTPTHDAVVADNIIPTGVVEKGVTYPEAEPTPEIVDDAPPPFRPAPNPITAPVAAVAAPLPEVKPKNKPKIDKPAAAQ